MQFSYEVLCGCCLFFFSLNVRAGFIFFFFFASLRGVFTICASCICCCCCCCIWSFRKNVFLLQGLGIYYIHHTLIPTSKHLMRVPKRERKRGGRGEVEGMSLLFQLSTRRGVNAFWICRCFSWSDNFNRILSTLCFFFNVYFKLIFNFFLLHIVCTQPRFVMC